MTAPHGWRPLEGVKVLDLTSVVMGPFGTQTLADLGADVTVIEDHRGDANRAMGSSRHPGLSGVSLGLMRNKRSIGVDLKSDEGREVLDRLVADADVFVTNLRPATRGRLGITYERLTTIKPDLIYCTACGFPPDSDRADDPAYDDVIQGLVGVPHMLELAGLPATYLPTIFVDKTSGMVIAQAITAALVQHGRSGEGVEINLSMYDIMRGYLLAEHGADSVSFPGERRAGYARLLAADRRPQPTADGHIAALPYEQRHFETLFKLAGRDELLDDPRIRTRRGLIDHRTELRALVEECLATKTTDEWLELLPANGVPAARLGTLDDLLDGLEQVEHPHAGNHVVVPSLLGDHDPAIVRHPAPIRAENTRAVLAEAGYTDAEIDKMFANGAINTAGPGEPGG